MHTKIFTTDDKELKIYFRIPFFAYFVGREWWDSPSIVRGRKSYKWSPLYLYRKEFDGSISCYIRV